MNADLLAMLSGGGPNAANANRRSGADESGTEILKFKAGKMKADLQPNGKYLVSPDPRRGEIRMLWKANESSPASGAASSGSGSSTSAQPSNAGVLTFEWVDRRTTLPVTTLTIFPEDSVTFARINTGTDTDRVYLLQYGNASDRRFFFWMQDKTDEKDEERAGAINEYCADGTKAAEKAREVDGSGDSAEAAGAAAGGGGASGSGGTGGGAVDSQSLMQIMQGLQANSATGGGSGSGGAAGAGAGSAGQVDALSSILENLGTSAGGTGTGTGGETASGSAPSAAAAAASTPAPSGTGSATPAAGGLTLADLQGAMAGLATSTPPGTMSPSAAAGPPLSDLATPAAISETNILSDPTVRSRLMELLPENQRTDAMLEENIRSPQVSQCLKSLTAALSSGPEEFNSVLANFQLKPEDGAAAMASGNPIQAFLDCLLKSVEREKKEKDEAAAAAGGGAAAAAATTEGKEEGKDGSGEDSKMEE